MKDLEFQLNTYARHGGKTSRRRQVTRVRQFIKFCRGLGIRDAGQIGNKHVWLWYQDGNPAPTTLRDRFYAVCLLWTLLKRGEPPRPKFNEPVNSLGEKKSGIPLVP